MKFKVFWVTFLGIGWVYLVFAYFIRNEHLANIDHTKYEEAFGLKTMHGLDGDVCSTASTQRQRSWVHKWTQDLWCCEDELTAEQACMPGLLNTKNCFVFLTARKKSKLYEVHFYCWTKSQFISKLMRQFTVGFFFGGGGFAPEIEEWGHIVFVLFVIL